MRIWKAGLLSVVLAVTIGCRNSQPAMAVRQSTPAVATAPEQKLALPGTEAAKTPVTVKPVQITPPASVSVRGENGPAEFVVQAQKGQFVHVEVDGSDPRLPAITMTATLSGSDGPVKSLLPDYCFYESLYPIGQDGALNISVDPGGQKDLKLDFSLLSSNDPLVDPGIRPEQISFADKTTVEPVPYDHLCEIGDSWPASISSKGGKLLFRIAQVAGYKGMFPKDKGMELLVSSLAPGAAAPDAKDLPYPNSGGDAATVMTARPVLIKGDGWKAWRWIEGSSQDGDYPGGIFFVAEGLTDDQRFFFRATAIIDHQAVRSLSPQNSARYDENGSRLRLQKALAVAEPSSFTPDLNELDAIVSSLRIRR